MSLIDYTSQTYLILLLIPEEHLNMNNIHNDSLF